LRSSAIQQIAGAAAIDPPSNGRRHASPMDDQRVGRLFRAVRQNRQLRQADVAWRAGISQKTVSEIELGRLEAVGLAKLRRIATVLDVALSIDARWHGGRGDQLLDRAHAHLVNVIAGILERDGWELRPEFTFNHYGDRGSVDILAWHAATRTLLIVEVKATLTDLQDLLAALSRKVRVVPRLVGEELGWRPEHVARLLVVGDTKATRNVVARHAAVFDSAFPARSREARTWISRPTGTISALWFASSSAGRAAPVARERVRRSGSRERRQ
jgi:transcriptional regulator with XRE-family HTH domain